MDTNNPNQSRKVHINSHILGLKRPPPLQKTVRYRKASDYPGVPQAYLDVAQYYANPLLLGPPICDELVALVQHMFTEDEAEVARHIKSPLGKTARDVAAAVHRPVDEVYPILERLAYEKFIMLSIGSGEKKRYTLVPIVPGTFDLVLIHTSLDALSDWHRRFAELCMSLYETGYLLDYARHPAGPAGLRYIPVSETINAHQMAWPANRLEEIWDRYKVFAVGLCDCRTTEQILGRGCGRPLENCIGFGDMVEVLIQRGKMRRLEKKDALAIKAEAAAAGLANLMVTLDLPNTAGGISCSCCGCCCISLRTISQFNRPGLLAPPHFMPKVALAQCTYCAKCAKVCPVQALVVDAKNHSLKFRSERCVGCGLCAVTCDQRQAIQMEPIKKNIQLTEGKLANLTRVANYVRGVWTVWWKDRA